MSNKDLRNQGGGHGKTRSFTSYFWREKKGFLTIQMILHNIPSTNKEGNLPARLLQLPRWYVIHSTIICIFLMWTTNIFYIATQYIPIYTYTEIEIFNYFIKYILIFFFNDPLHQFHDPPQSQTSFKKHWYAEKKYQSGF